MALLQVFHYLRPRQGWPPFGLALAVVACLSLAADASPLDLPALTIGSVALLGLWLGMRLHRAKRGGASTPRAGRMLRLARSSALLLIWGLGLALFALAVGRALPPLGLIWRDATGLTAALEAALDTASWAPLAATFAQLDSIAFLRTTIPRFAEELRQAPDAGRSGARLIVTMASIALAWSSGLLLGQGMARHQGLLGWSLPMVLTLTTTVILGGAGGIWLVLGVGALLGLVLLGTAQQREQHWQAAQVDYAEDLRSDALLWGGLVLLLVLPLAAVLPFTFDNPLAQAIWRHFNPPSGLAELDRTIQRGQTRPWQAPQPQATVAFSQLPALELGLSLEEQPPETVVLRVRTSAPLPSSQWPHYWRARVLSRYTGRAWSAPAIVQPQPALSMPAMPPTGMILQEVDDLRRTRTLLFGLPNIVGFDLATNSERLADGTLAAATSSVAPSRYRVLSLPPELATPASAAAGGQPAPDLAEYLALPPDLPPRVGDLARTLTRDSSTRYAAALALERYLRELPYSYTVAPLPPAGDGVDQFLFSMRQGYCTYYASAMAVMARTLGIPARVAVGYSTGSYDPASGSYTVRESDAHAWPELYLDGRWLPFEPTPVRPLPLRTVAGPSAALSPADEPLPTALATQLRPYLVGLLLGVGILLIVALALLGRQLAQRKGWSLVPLGWLSPAAIQFQFEHYGLRLGVPWPAGATLQEYAALLAPRLGPAAPALAQLVALLEQARYSPDHTLSAAELAQLRAAWQQLRRHRPADPATTAPDLPV